ncbi:hypothetical protein F5148DRAFT_986986, partial [Russula earlei]
PTWGSLTWDYLEIMSSSVSSERAFLQGEITISKCHSRLKGVLVEALQSHQTCCSENPHHHRHWNWRNVMKV